MDTVLSSVKIVPEIKEILTRLEARVATLETRMDRLLAHTVILTQIKNDNAVIKSTLATLEGLMTTIKIMDPGTTTSQNASNVKKLFSEHTVVLSGPNTGPIQEPFPSVIELDPLARPKPQAVNKTPANPKPMPELNKTRAMLTNLNIECVKDPVLRQNFEIKIASAATFTDLVDLKRQILRNAV